MRQYRKCKSSARSTAITVLSIGFLVTFSAIVFIALAISTWSSQSRQLPEANNQNVHQRQPELYYDETLASVRLINYKLRAGDGSLLDQAAIELSVHNESRYALRRIYFHATLKTPGRQIPWIDADFNYEPPGGLEPDEAFSKRLEPSIFQHSEWRKAAFSDSNAKFTVTIESAETADGTMLE